MTDFTTQAIHVGRESGQYVTVTVTAEPTACPHLVITPAVRDTKDDRVTLTGGLALTHTLTGRRVAGSTNTARLHTLAGQLASLDWNFTAADHLYTHPDMRDAAIVIIRDWQMTEAFDGPAYTLDDDADTRAARAADPAGTLLGEQLDWWIRHAEGYWDGLDWGNPDHQRIRAAEIGTSCQGYSTIYLLAVLRAVDPNVADIAARTLIGALDAGDGLGEWVNQWRQELAEGQPLTLHGIPTRDPLAEFEA